MPDAMQWCVVVPVKELARAKSRLAHLTAEQRADLALAMAADVVSAALAASSVAAVVVVTNDARAAAHLGSLGARVVADTADAGIDEALVEAARHVAVLWPRCGIAALSSDLPCTRPHELDVALERAARHDRALVADRDGDGTTLLTARPGVALRPRYGVGSRSRHVADGARQIEADDLPGMRLDVDTPGDLASANQLGPGELTRAVMLRLDHG